MNQEELTSKGWVLEDGIKVLEVYEGEINGLTQMYMGTATVQLPSGEVESARLDWWISTDGRLHVDNLEIK